MKELSIEKKAKHYDKAIERAEGLIDFCSDSELKTLEYVFPELKESEDERIRKELIKHLKDGAEGYEPAGNCEDYKRWLSWVEKQGEQKTVDKIEPKFGVGDKIQYSKGCGTIMTIEKIENGEYIFANNMGHTTIEDGNKWYLVEQKPTWGEDDENKFQIIQKIICDSDTSSTLANRLSKWLKSLKDRVQPKQEWGEDDESYLNTTIAYLKDAKEFKKNAENCINWLKSLKPQNRWKPSEGQMEFLKKSIEAYNEVTFPTEVRVLSSLYNDLKKLKG